MTEPGPPLPEDDVLELGTDRIGMAARLGRIRGLRYLAAAATCAVISVATVVALHPARAVNGAGRLAIAATRHSTRVASRPPHSGGYDAPIRAVLSLARHRGTLPSYVRQTSPAGSCALVKIGRSPLRTAARALARAAPRFRIRDTATVLDQFTGLCALQLRADGAAGAVLVVSVTSPNGHPHRSTYDRVQTGFELAPRATTKYAVVTTPRGFNVLVGATGPMRSLPADRQLIGLAHDPALTW